MRNQWLRMLLLRCRAPSQVNHLRSFTSALLHPRAPHVTPKPSPFRHQFTSSPESAVRPPKPLSDEATLLVEAFAKSGSCDDEINLDLDSKNVSATDDLILSVLGHPDTDEGVAERISAWVFETQNEAFSSRVFDLAYENENGNLNFMICCWVIGEGNVKLSSKAYNLLLKFISRRGLVKDAWFVIEAMYSKGYAVSESAFDEVSENVHRHGLCSDLERLEWWYSQMHCSAVTAIVKAWGDDVEQQLQELGVELCSCLVSMVLKDSETGPDRAWTFFRWLEERNLFEHDQRTYNSMATVLSEEDHTRKFWRFLDEMRNKGHEMERHYYVDIVERFVERKMMKDAVDLYEFAMVGWDKPSPKDRIFLLKKIVGGEELDMNLFSKALVVSKARGNVLTVGDLDSVIASLASVGKMAECGRVLSAMEEHGFVLGESSQSKIAVELSKGGETGEARVASGNISDYGTWVSLVNGYCEAHDLDGASRSFRAMVEKGGASWGGHALDLLVSAYCRENKPLDAYKFVAEMVNSKGVSHWNSTCKALASKLLAKNYFKEAIDVMTMMKLEDKVRVPDLDPFVEYLSETGSAEDAIVFSQAVPLDRFSSTLVFVQLFEEYRRAGRESVARDFLLKFPSYVENHADVLDLIYLRKHSGIESEAVAV
ncbi:hypothetical protein ABFX02_08G036800 [Erythranthe guttata]